ncbi:MAG TPA: hypothetical protein VHO66_02180 [Ruminiclostridium sp.]|nr:hypothetical protein [Ruminiclostridium sp.]
MLKKRLTAVAVICMMVVVQVSSATLPAYGKDLTSTADKSHCSTLLDPETGKYLPVRNVEQEFAKITARQPRNTALEKNFVEHHQQMRQKKNTVNSKASAPVPGDVAGGFTYTNDFRKNFTQGTAISYDIICPTTVGGNNSNYLYLTSTDRASSGTEALISYYGQNNMEFKVYDWARPDGDQWRISMPIDTLTPYLRTGTIHNVNYQYISVEMCTEFVSGDTWENIVWLKNSNGTFDLIYNYYYTSSLESEQRSVTWGPIVETFQDSYSNTNTVGFNNIRLCQADSKGTWSGWSYLSDSEAGAYDLAQGFKFVFSDPDYAYAVKS